MDQLQLTATFPNIASDKLGEFKKLAGEAMEIVRTMEPGTLQYDWFFNADETQCVVRETYASSDAVMAHMGNMGELLGEIAALGGGIEIEIFGDPSATLREAAAQMQPAVYSYFQGK